MISPSFFIKNNRKTHFPATKKGNLSFFDNKPHLDKGNTGFMSALQASNQPKLPTGPNDGYPAWISHLASIPIQETIDQHRLSVRRPEERRVGHDTIAIVKW